MKNVLEFDNNDDWNDESDPNLYIWPDSAAPLLVLKIGSGKQI